jgi:hypothetical protein
MAINIAKNPCKKKSLTKPQKKIWEQYVTVSSISVQKVRKKTSIKFGKTVPPGREMWGNQPYSLGPASARS